MRLKGISILNLFEQIQENTISGSAFSARLGSSAVAFITDLTNVHMWELSQNVDRSTVGESFNFSEFFKSFRK